MRYAYASNEVIRREIWPHFRKLAAEDIRDQMLQEMLQQLEAQTGGQGIPAGSPTSPGESENSSKPAQPGREQPSDSSQSQEQNGASGFLGKLSRLVAGMFGRGQATPELPEITSLVDELQKRLEGQQAGNAVSKPGTSGQEKPLRIKPLLNLMRETLSPLERLELNEALKDAREMQEMRDIADEVFEGNQDRPDPASETTGSQRAAVDLESLSSDLKMRIEEIIRKFEPQDGEKLIGKASARLLELQDKLASELEGQLHPGQATLPLNNYRKSDPNRTS